MDTTTRYLALCLIAILAISLCATGVVRAEMTPQISTGLVIPPLGRVGGSGDGFVEIATRIDLNSVGGATKKLRILPSSGFTDAELNALKLVEGCEELDLSFNNHLTFSKFPAKELKLKRLSLRHCSKTFPSALQGLMGMGSLTSLDLAYISTVSDGSVEDIAKLKLLEELDLSGTAITIATMREVAKLTKLRVLRLRNMPALSEAAFNLIGSLTSLETLDLSGSGGLSDGALAKISFTCPLIRHLNLSDCLGLDKGAPASLSNFPALEHFNGSGCTGATDEWVISLAKNRKLTSLVLDLPVNRSGAGYSPPGDKAVASLLKRSELSQLRMTGWSITEASLYRIGLKLLKLEELSIAGCRGVLPHAIEYLVPLKSLKKLEMGYLRYKDSDFNDLAKLTWLESLSLQGMPHITSRSFEQLKTLKSLRHLDLSRTPIQDFELTKLEALSSLKELDLTACPNINGTNLHKLSGLEGLILDACPLKDGFESGLKECKRLERLSLLGCPQYTGVKLDELKDNRSLRLLNLGGERLSGEAATALRKLDGLEVLNLIGAGFSDQDVMKVRDLKRTLRFVGIYHCPKASRIATNALREGMAGAKVSVW